MPQVRIVESADEHGSARLFRPIIESHEVECADHHFSGCRTRSIQRLP